MSRPALIGAAAPWRLWRRQPRRGIMPAAPSVSAARAASIAAPRVTDSPLAAAVPAPSAPLAAVRTAIAAAGESAARPAAPAPAPARRPARAGAGARKPDRWGSHSKPREMFQRRLRVEEDPRWRLGAWHAGQRHRSAPSAQSERVGNRAGHDAARIGRRRLGLWAERGGDLRIRRIVRELVGLPLEADGARHYGILRSVPSGPRSQLR